MIGTVVSNKMTKALVVLVTRVKLNTKYNKRYKVRKKYHVTCSDSSKFQIGQTIQIQPCRPISKTIRFKAIEE